MRDIPLDEEGHVERTNEHGGCLEKGDKVLLAVPPFRPSSSEARTWVLSLLPFQVDKDVIQECKMRLNAPKAGHAWYLEGGGFHAG